MLLPADYYYKANNQDKEDWNGVIQARPLLAHGYPACMYPPSPYHYHDVKITIEAKNKTVRQCFMLEREQSVQVGRSTGQNSSLNLPFENNRVWSTTELLFRAPKHGPVELFVVSSNDAALYVVLSDDTKLGPIGRGTHSIPFGISRFCLKRQKSPTQSVDPNRATMLSVDISVEITTAH
jgi:hypothetical protein